MDEPRVVRCEVCNSYTPGVYEGQHKHILQLKDEEIERLKLDNQALLRMTKNLRERLDYYIHKTGLKTKKKSWTAKELRALLIPEEKEKK